MAPDYVPGGHDKRRSRNHLHMEGNELGATLKKR
jgi:hypothetical protein